MSQGLLVALATWLINVFVGPSDGWANVLFDYGFMRPGSRKQEVGIPSGACVLHERRLTSFCFRAVRGGLYWVK